MKRPRMSASDSDCSIDWLASDEEDNACEQGLECDRAQVMFTSAPAASDSCGSQVCTSTKENKDTSCSRSSSPSSSTSSFSSSESELSSSRQEDPTDYSRTSGSPKGKSRQAQKRVRSMQASEQKDKHFTVNQTEKDKLFACKCMELQCYIHPLSSILNGLRSGRYRERLSTFQESVAMDRIQRIMGVLQNPYMGERYINIILKMEEMLKVWFPHIKPNHQASALDLTQDITLLKKPKLSSAPLSSAAPGINPGTICPAKAMRVSDLTPPALYSATNLKWLHTSPICSHTAEQTHRTIQNFLTARRSEDVTQDNSVSSTIDTPEPKDSMPNQPPPGKISAPCLERLLKSTESIISHKTSMGNMGASTWS